jgi:tetratricopeptide (TPR) repeat protein
MSNARKALIGLFLLIVISTSIHSVLAQENKTSTTQNATFAEASPKSEVTQEDILIEAQRNFDRSLSILNIVATSMGVLVGLITIIFVIAIAVGFFEYSKWKAIRKDIEKEANIIRELRLNAEKDASTLRNEIEKIPLTSLTENPSKEIVEKLDEFSRKLKLVEILGGSLKPEDYFNLGYDLYFKGKYELALEATATALELKPNYAHAWNAKSATLIRLGRYDEALKAAEKAIELKPDFASAWFNLACFYSIKGNKEKTLSNLKKAIELDASYKEKAKKDKDFENLWDDEDFKEVVK